MPVARLLVVCLLVASIAAACEQPTPSRAPTATQTAQSATGLPATPGATRPPATSTVSPAAATATATVTPTATPTTAPTAPPTGPPAVFDPNRVELAFEPFVTGLNRLTFVTHAGDGSGELYAVEQDGRIVVVARDGTVRDEPFLDVAELVSTGFEQGLLGLAFHPHYTTNRRLFVHYTDTAGDTVVAEYTATPDGHAADPESERVLLTTDQPFANHNGGMVVFGPDGYLYISLGDGGSGGDPLGTGQDPGDLLGSILRIDVDAQQPYAIPADNPFVGESGAQPEVWAWGLRNPWRLSFDRATGDMFIGDVGQGAWEEIDVEPAGAGGRNYGWNVMEGPDCFRAADCDATGLTLPVTAYRRADGNCAVTGGYVYRGEQFPELVGGYFFSDYCSGEVWAFDAATAVAGGAVEHVRVGSSGISPGSFGEDQAGELYLAGQGGEILRIAGRAR